MKMALIKCHVTTCRDRAQLPEDDSILGNMFIQNGDRFCFYRARCVKCAVDADPFAWREFLQRSYAVHVVDLKFIRQPKLNGEFLAVLNLNCLCRKIDR